MHFCKQTSARLTVDLAAIRKNHAWLAKHVEGAECAAVVKADAYGLGMREVASCLADNVQTFFVAQPEEGRQLRRLLPEKKIFVLHGFAPGRPETMAEYELVPVLNSLDQVRQWRAFCQREGTDHPAALQLDTGMSRFGISEDDLGDEVVRGLKPVLVMSHLACADQPDDPANEEQRQRFLAMSVAFPDVPRSLAASAGIFLGPDYHFEMVRPGIALYGPPLHEETNLLVPAVRLEAQILQVRTIEAGGRIGYGLTYRAVQPMRVATVGIGYADGIFRSFARNGALWKGDIRLPVLGRISMDSLSVDVTHLPDDATQEGEWLTVIGPQQDIADMADHVGTIGYEVLTSLGYRFDRFYQG
ncbi:alanine racemase [Bombella favorum]|uniref:Alanine racemase n=1 Tax=Bombella favorum TaxID=2039164 RepID=A0ABR5ZKY2_9PROT|nr:alanine racemase [Bombella favorum]MBA5724934.1 alanine racemase [Bombella favorum]